MALKAVRAMAKYGKDKEALWGIQAGRMGGLSGTPEKRWENMGISKNRGVSKNRGTPKWMVKIIKNPIESIF